MAQTIQPFLMFTGRAEEAMRFYTSLFHDGAIVEIERWRDGEQGRPGAVKRATFRLAGREFLCSDSPVEHAFTFTPSLSLLVTFDDDAEFARVFEQLAVDGRVLMPPGDYGFSKRFAWLDDRFGVSWQLDVRA